ncbi:fucolectin-like [Pyxicephalus adspersus]|uniref:fucolectin-like n=1 Tax=Pyxicephalus adspersus TaxID=30357 RepID=UPI003B5BB063
MKAFVAFFLLISLGLSWCCSPDPGAINIALTGEASQSSTLPYTNFANKSIDGSKDLNWMHGSCSHTEGEVNPWWRIDLKNKYKVNVVVVSGRTDCCLSRLLGAELRIGDCLNNYNPVCGIIKDVSGPTTTFCCNGMEGQYVSVVIPARFELLTLCEVMVYGDLVTE